MTSTVATRPNLTITTRPSTGVSVVADGKSARSIKAVRFITLTGAEAQRTFTSTDTDGKVGTYRVTTIRVYEDGSVWAWAAQITKKGHPFKNGMGVTMGGVKDMARIYGQDVKDVVNEADDLARMWETDHAAALDENVDYDLTRQSTINSDYIEALAEQAIRDRGGIVPSRLDDIEAALGLEPFTPPSMAPATDTTVTYDVLYSVPVPGLDVRALALAYVTVGPIDGKPYTTIADIPKIIETRKGYPTGHVEIVSTESVQDDIDPAAPVNSTDDTLDPTTEA